MSFGGRIDSKLNCAQIGPSQRQAHHIIINTTTLNLNTIHYPFHLPKPSHFNFYVSTTSSKKTLPPFFSFHCTTTKSISIHHLTTLKEVIFCSGVFLSKNLLSLSLSNLCYPSMMIRYCFLVSLTRCFRWF